MKQWKLNLVINFLTNKSIFSCLVEIFLGVAWECFLGSTSLIWKVLQALQGRVRGGEVQGGVQGPDLGEASPLE